jgi:hypothetical protein
MDSDAPDGLGCARWTRMRPMDSDAPDGLGCCDRAPRGVTGTRQCPHRRPRQDSTPPSESTPFRANPFPSQPLSESTLSESTPFRVNPFPSQPRPSRVGPAAAGKRKAEMCAARRPGVGPKGDPIGSATPNQHRWLTLGADPGVCFIRPSPSRSNIRRPAVQAAGRERGPRDLPARACQWRH